MWLRVYVNETTQDIEVPSALLTEAGSFFAKMDNDMDKGHQMSRTWIPHPNQTQRCQIVADRLLTALSTGREKSVQLMSAYILQKAPDVTEIHFNTHGDMTDHVLITKAHQNIQG